MSGWSVLGFAITASVAWTVVLNMRDRRRQLRRAATRTPLSAEDFRHLLSAADVNSQIADFLWSELKPYYFASLTPHPDDCIYGDLTIDPDDISDIIATFEKRFGYWVGELPLDCSDDPSIAEFATALQKVVSPITA